MIAHIAGVGISIFAVFVIGCGLGALLFLFLGRSRFANAQWLVADGLGRVEDAVRDRFGLAPVYRARWRLAPPVPVPLPTSEESPVWDVVERAVADEATYEDETDERYELELADDADPVPVEVDDGGLDVAVEDPAGQPEAAWFSEEGDEQEQIVEETFDADEPLDELPLEDEVDLPTAFAVVPPSGLFIAPPESLDIAEEDGEISEATEWARSPLAADGPAEEPPLLVARADETGQTGDGLEMRRPAMLNEPRNGMPDNLQRIRGIGERNEIRLNRLGIFHFSQIASWTPAEIRWIGQQLSFPERIEHDDWVGQAIVLASGGETGFTKSAERRRARRRGDGDTESGEDEPFDET